MLRSLHIDQHSCVGHSHHHPVTFYITDSRRKVEICNLLFLINTEEYQRLSELKIMFYLIVFTLTEHLHDKLIQRVIIALTHFNGIPCITTLHLSLQPHLFSLLAKGLLLSCILHLEQEPLLL